MKFRSWIALLVLFATGAPVDAQSVSGLSTKPPAAPVVDEMDVDAIKSLLGLANKLASELTAQQRQALEKALSGRSTLLEARTSVNLAVPAGATTSFGENGQASAGPRLGFQAWKPDDFFAGAFFTFDAAPKLTGDLRKAGQFVRDPPNSGSSFLVSGNRMYWRYRCGRFVNLRPARQKKTRLELDARAQMPADDLAREEEEDELQRLRKNVVDDPCYVQPGDKEDAFLIGFSARAGASMTTLEHTRETPEGEELADPETHEASIYHASLSLLVTSRTFSTEDGGEYQFGLEAGRTMRWIGGDAAAHEDFLAQPDVFGHPRKNLNSWDLTFFARLNGFQPFVRITRMSRNGLHVAGLTGTQASFGVNVLSSLFQTTKEARKDGTEEK